jgi:hypothetical protein
MPDGTDVPSRSFWARVRGFSRPLALGALAVLAFQFGLHFHMYWNLPRGEEMAGSMPFIPAMVGTPMALCWALLVVRWARRCEGQSVVSGHVLRLVAEWTLIVAVAFAVYVTDRAGWEMVPFWIFTIVVVTPLSVGTAPLLGVLVLFQDFPWRLLVLAGIGAASVGPMLLLIWLARPRAATTPAS